MFDERTQSARPAVARGAAASTPYTVPNRLFEIDKLISKLARTVNRDPDVSPALASVVRELQQRSKRAMRIAEHGGEQRAREVVIDLEQVVEQAEWAARREAASPAPIRLLIADMRDRINGLTDDLLGNDSE
jgi:hypothetical protein